MDISYAEDFSEFLVRTAKVDAAAIERAQAIQLGPGAGTIVDVLVHIGLISANSLADGIAEFAGLRRARPEDIPSEPLNLPGLNLTYLKASKSIPLSVDGEGVLRVMAVNPLEAELGDAFGFIHDARVEFLVATAREVEEAFARLYETSAEPSATQVPANLGQDLERLRELASDAPVVKFVDHLIEEALVTRASDIHLETTEEGLRCRLRIDGILKDTTAPLPDLSQAIISRVKIMSGLDIAERRIPQDGRMRHRIAGREIDFRVATSPTSNGESAVVRLLDKANLSFDFEDLGFDGSSLTRLLSAFSKPDGIILVTGPTGSGKTTTLYAALTHLNNSERKILTVEDPIEYTLPGVNQTQVEPRINRTFATMLRSFLRQDPDIIMVGEIRDHETAEIAIQAALTGHLVLSTLHTNDAASAVTRLLDMGVESFLISSTVRLIIAQRLIRKLCEHCREISEPDEALAASWREIGICLGGPPYRPVGCPHCQATGYLGRVAISECLAIDDEIKGLIHQRAESSEIHRRASANGMRSMLAHGLERVSRGETTVDEVLRVTMRR